MENLTEKVKDLDYVDLINIQGGGIIDTIKRWFGIDTGFQFGGGSSGGGGASGSW